MLVELFFPGLKWVRFSLGPSLKISQIVLLQLDIRFSEWVRSVIFILEIAPSRKTTDGYGCRRRTVDRGLRHSDFCLLTSDFVFHIAFIPSLLTNSFTELFRLSSLYKKNSIFFSNLLWIFFAHSIPLVISALWHRLRKS